GFADTFLVKGAPPSAGSLFKQPRMAATLRRLAQRGTNDFYRGGLAKQMAAELEQLGSPLRAADLAAYEARLVNPLTSKVHGAGLRNMQPPSQGVVSMMILGIMDRVMRKHPKCLGGPTSANFVHVQVEATKLAFKVRDQQLTDPAFMKVSAQSLLSDDHLDALAAQLELDRAAPWGAPTEPGDTVWMGVVDQQGVAVSFIQSIYHEFGSGLVLPESGVNWQNRGCGFSLDPSHINCLAPRKRPFHTLNAGLAELDGGGTMVYGTMGGDGQPQTQATVFTRIHHFGMDPQAAIEAPRWLLGRTWGQASDSLKLESRFGADVVEALRAKGHWVESIGAWDESVGHAGAIIRQPNGLLSGGFDPRSNGAVAAF
ncbi:MAG TPA: gamma-glutamyltransferase, partial [Burkholderiaceae bacterium]|nr:gamma-glutamyltransferase [Burkholderiaceae bacterium]